jgi:ribosomal-protein-alanine N-acetyltransferase
LKRRSTHTLDRGNFTDSFLSGYQVFGIRDHSGEIAAYFFVMPVVDELHLLNFAVRKENQGQGYASAMLRYLHFTQKNKASHQFCWKSGGAIIALLRFTLPMALKKSAEERPYYPVDVNTREDAIVMRRMC